MKKINKEDIDKYITMKAVKVSKYQKNISDVRLLLVSNRMSNSGRAWLPEESKFKKQGFSEIYYLSYPDSVKKLSS